MTGLDIIAAPGRIAARKRSGTAIGRRAVGRADIIGGRTEIA